MNLSSVKNIVFDLGDVIINLDFEKTYQAFAMLAKRESVEIAAELKQNKLFDKHGNGDISDAEFRQEVRQLLDADVSDEAIDKAFNALLRDIPLPRLNLLKELSKKYRLFLLSNTNEIHITKVNEILFQCSGFRNLEPLFEKVYYSHEMKLSKPDVRIYHQVMEENELLPAETLFIDDNPDNIQGALLAGMQARQVVPPITILELFADAAK